MPVEPENVKGSSTSPLTGVRVIDLTPALAGPFCTLVLAGLGADVIKVEDPAGGDIARGNAPYVGERGLSLAAEGPEDFSLATLTRSRVKRSITLNLKHPGAATVFKDLVREADVVVENFSSGTADRLGIGYGIAREANPAIIYCSISGFGAGTDSGVRAMDTIIQALSGVMLSSGSPDDPPVRVGVSDGRRPRSGMGGGGDPRSAPAPPSHRAGRPRRRVDARRPDVVCGDRGLGGARAAGAAHAYRSDPSSASSVWPVPLRGRMGGALRPAGEAGRQPVQGDGPADLLDDPRFATRDARVHHDQALTTEIQRWSMQRSTTDVVASLQQAGVPAVPVRSPQEAVQDERVIAREETLPVQHPTLGSIDGLRTTGIPFRLAASRIGFERLAPRLGEHTAELLRDVAGYSTERCRELYEDGAV
jgi:CoA:oxalate CoA-transferase